MRKKRMLITGISGLLGNNLAFCFRETYEILGIYYSHRVEIEGIHTRRLDLTAGSGIKELITKFEPEIVIHGAAQADVEICEEYPREAENINVLGTHNLVMNLGNPKTKLIYISTDLVYDGIKGDFSEDDPLNPLNHYGKTKCKAEQEVLSREGSLILRVNFFGWNVQDKHSLGEWVIHELTRQREIQGFTDCTFSTMYTFELAKLIDLAIKRNLSGIYNCVSSASMSKYNFISEIASRLNLNADLIKPILIDDFGFKAKRGKRLNLNTNKLAKDLGVEIPSINHSIECFVKDFKKGVPEIIKSKRCQRNIYPVSLDIIPYGRQSIDEEDIAAVVDVLKSEAITQGTKANEFQSALCKATDASFAVAVNSGTSALHISCLVAEIGPSDEVITSPNTFVASANCVVYCKGRPIFADIDPHTYNISPREIEKKLTERTKAIIPVHFAGQSCDMEAIYAIVKAAERKYGHKIYIIEDACHALGSYYEGTKVGSCAYSDMAVLSFHPVKHITTAEGGAVSTNSKELARKLNYFRSHGITSVPDEFCYPENSLEADTTRKPWYYEQNFLGYNYRITEIQCALGISQFKKLEKFRRRRREIVEQYNNAFKNVETVKIPHEEASCDSNFHLYVLQVYFEKIGLSRSQMMIELKKRGIQTQVHYIPVYTQPFYRKNFGTQWGDCPVTEQYYQKCLSIPLYPTMTNEDVQRVVSGIKGLVGAYDIQG